MFEVYIYVICVCGPKVSTLNRKNELASCCRHARKFLLKIVFT